jgi:DNA polymerase I
VAPSTRLRAGFGWYRSPTGSGRACVYDAFRQDPDVIRRAVEACGELAAHNATFERKWLKAALALDRPDLHDTMVMSQVLYTGTNAARSKQFSHGLQATAKRELKAELDKSEQDGEWDAYALTPEQIRYAARDAHVLPELASVLLKKLEKAGLMEVYELERRVSYAVDQMERNGFGIDPDKLDAFILWRLTSLRPISLTVRFESVCGFQVF